MTKDVRILPNEKRVGILNYEGVQMSAVYGLAEMFELSNRIRSPAEQPAICTEILTREDGYTKRGLDAIVIPPNLTSRRGKEDGATLAWLREQHNLGVIMCSACAGAFWLGHAGLLNGRTVTTHWAVEEEFRTTFPDAQLQPEHLLIDENDLVTAGGLMAWVDLGLHLVRRFLGPSVVTKLSRHMLIDPSGREQRNYRAFSPNLNHGDDTIRMIQLWMEENVGERMTVSTLAMRAMLPVRTFQRRFQSCTGIAVGQYVQELRIERARGLLERTTHSVVQICWAVGYEDPSAFSRLFKAKAGLSASEYRRRFKVE